MRRGLRLTLAACFGLVVPSVSFAAGETTGPRGGRARPAQRTPGNDEGSREARALFERGNTCYNVRDFACAIEAWTEAYKRSGDANLLYNLGQAHRLAGHPPESLFHYRGYLRARPEAPNRAAVEALMKEVESTWQLERARPPAEGTSVVRADRPPESHAGSEDASASSSSSSRAPERLDTSVNASPTDRSTSPSPWEGEVGSGAVLWSGPLRGSIDPSWLIALRGARRFGAGVVSLDLGAALTYTSLLEPRGRVHVPALLLGPDLRVQTGRSLAFNAGVGVGALAYLGLARGSVFLREDAAPPANVIVTPTVRAAMGASVAMSRAVVLFLAPAVGWSAKASAFEGAPVRIELLAGLRFAPAR